MKTLHVTTREEWRAWLAAHHATETEIWIVYYKQHTGQPRISYDEVVEEALCYGWIDSLVRRLDDERYAQKVTPRKNTSKWSESNLRRFANLVKNGRMTSAEEARRGGDFAGAGQEAGIEVKNEARRAILSNHITGSPPNVETPHGVPRGASQRRRKSLRMPGTIPGQISVPDPNFQLNRADQSGGIERIFTAHVSFRRVFVSNGIAFPIRRRPTGYPVGVSTLGAAPAKNLGR